MTWKYVKVLWSTWQQAWYCSVTSKCRSKNGDTLKTRFGPQPNVVTSFDRFLCRIERRSFVPFLTDLHFWFCSSTRTQRDLVFGIFSLSSWLLARSARLKKFYFFYLIWCTLQRLPNLVRHGSRHYWPQVPLCASIAHRSLVRFRI